MDVRKVALAVGAVSLAVIAGVTVWRARAARPLPKVGETAGTTGISTSEPTSRPADPRIDGSDEVAGLRRRIAALESEKAELATKNAELERKMAAATRLSGANRLTDPKREREFTDAELQSIAADPARAATERLWALRQLRSGGSALRRDARTPEVVQAMLALMETSPEATMRADICRQVKGAVPYALKDPLLRALASDPVEDVREEAAETLGPLREDPVVAAALDHAAKNDPSSKVREEAGKRPR